MKIRVTSIAAEKVAAMLRDISNHFETSMNERMSSLTYQDFDQLMFTLVCSEDEYCDNEKLAKRIRLTGRAPDFLKGGVIRFINIGIPIDIQLLTSGSFDMVLPVVRDLVANAMRECRLPAGIGNDQLEYRNSVINVINSAKPKTNGV